MKTCKTCGILQPLEEFYRRLKQRDPHDGTCKECRKARARITSKTYFATHREVIAAKKPERDHRYSWQLRQRVFAQYGKRCACCGETCVYFLHITHPAGRKAPHVAEIGYRGGNDVCWYLQRHPFPADSRLLCAKCLRAVGAFRFCPHYGNDPREPPSMVQYRWRVRCDVLDAYGHAWACCGETNPYCLEIDHPNGDGTQHRRVIGVFAGGSLYRSLKRAGFPRAYRLLCSNCNTVRGWYGFCPHMSEPPALWRTLTREGEHPFGVTPLVTLTAQATPFLTWR
jgi:hypothetical protein